MKERLTIRVDGAESAIRASVGKALASALITGIDNCADEGRPLDQLQTIHLATMCVMAYDEALRACELLRFEAETLYRGSE